jgi:hypothetical protein
VAFHRAGADGIFRSITEATFQVENVGSSHITATYRDNGKYQVGITDIIGVPVYTTGGLDIEAVSPVGSRVPVVASGRLWIASSTGIQFSKNFVPGTATEDRIVPEFNEGFQFVTPSGEEPTGMAPMDGKMIAFTAGEIWAVAGRGPDKGGAGNDHSLMTKVSSDVGCNNPHSVVVGPFGVMFQSASGIHTLSRGMEVNYSGRSIEESFAGMTVTSAVLVPGEQQVRFTSIDSQDNSFCFVFDYTMEAWFVWTLSELGKVVSACMHAGSYYCLQDTGQVWKENYLSGYDNSVFFGQSVQTAWVQTAGQHGWQSLRHVILAADKMDATGLSISVDYDFGTKSEARAWTDAELLTFDNSAMVNPKLHTQFKKCHAFRITVTEAFDAATVAARGMRMFGIVVDVAQKKGTFKAGQAHGGS